MISVFYSYYYKLGGYTLAITCGDAFEYRLQAKLMFHVEHCRLSR
jgi:hypothetical protein